MMDEINLAFKDYVEKFKQLDIKDKRVEIINSVKEIDVLMETLAEIENKQLSFLRSNEITEFNGGLESEDDFLEALLVHIENAKNLLGQYLSDKI